MGYIFEWTIPNEIKMTKKYQKYSSFLGIQEMKIKTLLRFPHSPIIMAKIKKTIDHKH